MPSGPSSPGTPAGPTSGGASGPLGGAAGGWSPGWKEMTPRANQSARIVATTEPPRIAQLFLVMPSFVAMSGNLRASRGPAARHQEQDGHAHGEPALDLLQDQGARAVRDLGRDLDAAVDRPRVHDRQVRLGPLEASPGEPEQPRVLAHRREGEP